MSIVYVFTWDIELLLMSAGWRWSLLCLCIWFGLGAAELMSSFFFLELDSPYRVWLLPSSSMSLTPKGTL